ncbi:MAG: hypothetical protein M0Z79_00565 [Nitrospiraceae bacterium]|nr:hypothetical protein [Nitrospiraceae bacterium]
MQLVVLSDHAGEVLRKRADDRAAHNQAALDRYEAARRERAAEINRRKESRL